MNVLLSPHLFPFFMILGLVSPLAAIAAASLLYARHSRRVGRARQAPVIAYVLAIVVFGAAGGVLGLLVGLKQACPAAGNLCGLWPAFVTGPFFCALGILLVAIAVSSIRPAPRGEDAGASG